MSFIQDPVGLARLIAVRRLELSVAASAVKQQATLALVEARLVEVTAEQAGDPPGRERERARAEKCCCVHLGRGRRHADWGAARLVHTLRSIGTILTNPVSLLQGQGGSVIEGGILYCNLVEVSPDL